MKRVARRRKEGRAGEEKRGRVQKSRLNRRSTEEGSETFIRSGRRRGQREGGRAREVGRRGTGGIILFHLENNEGSMHLSGVAALTAPLLSHLLAPSLSIRLHVEHVNRFAHS